MKSPWEKRTFPLHFCQESSEASPGLRCLGACGLKTPESLVSSEAWVRAGRVERHLLTSSQPREKGLGGERLGRQEPCRWTQGSQSRARVLMYWWRGGDTALSLSRRKSSRTNMGASSSEQHSVRTVGEGPLLRRQVGWKLGAEVPKGRSKTRARVEENLFSPWVVASPQRGSESPGKTWITGMGIYITLPHFLSSHLVFLNSPPFVPFSCPQQIWLMCVCAYIFFYICTIKSQNNTSWKQWKLFWFGLSWTTKIVFVCGQSTG